MTNEWARFLFTASVAIPTMIGLLILIWAEKKREREEMDWFDDRFDPIERNHCARCGERVGGGIACCDADGDDGLVSKERAAVIRKVPTVPAERGEP